MTRADSVWDKFAVLSLFDRVSRNSGRVAGNTKAQKLLFLYELSGQRAGLKAAHFRFFRYTHGPFSPHLAEELAALEGLALIHRDCSLTKRGEFMVELLDDEAQSSMAAKTSLQHMDEIARDYGKVPGERLKQIVYGIVVPVIEDGSHRPVKDIPMHYDILDPSRVSELQDVRPFSERMIRLAEEELALPPTALDPDSPAYRRTIAEALERALSR
jgi:hypothetical protein